MNKIPVFATIGGAYRFAFGRFFGNLGVVWLPVLLVMVIGWFVMPRMMGAYSDAISHGIADPHNPTAALQGMMQAYRMIILYWIVALLLRAEMMLGLTRRALGTATGPDFVFLSFGKAYWRVAGAFFAVTIIFMAAEMVLVIAGLLVGGLAGVLAGVVGGGGKETIGIALGSGMAITIFAVVCILLYGFIRLTFFLTTVIVDTDRFDLTAPWRLAGGNFWRIVLIGVVVFVPLMIAMAVIAAPAMFWIVEPLTTGLSTAKSQDPQAVAMLMRTFTNGLREALLARWYVVVPLSLVSSTLIYGLATGASVTAYRALVPKVEPAAAS